MLAKCEACGSSYRTFPSLIGKRKYCSIRCVPNECYEKHPLCESLVVVFDGEGYFGFDRRFEETFSPVTTFVEARRWCLARFAERN